MKRAFTRLACLVLLATAAGAAAIYFWEQPEPLAELRVDANRDGRIDGADRGAAQSAIILVNCDDDDGDHTPDYENAAVDGEADLKDLGRIELGRLGGAKGLRVVLRACLPRAHEKPHFAGVAPERRIRVFLPGSEGTEILGPGAGATAELPATLLEGRGWVALGVEGLEFGSAATIRVEIWRGAEKISEDAVEVRCAPFMALSNLEHVEETLLSIADEGGLKNTYDFVDAFDRADKVWTRKLDVIFPEERAYDDAWTQDQWEIGWQSAPGPDGTANGMRVFLELPRDGALKRASRREIIRPDTGIYEKLRERLSRQAAASESLNFGGNFECSGPAPGHPAGRILLGDNLSGGPQKRVSEELIEFFKSQRIQEPVVVDTGWLVVGHIDQLLAVMPDGRLVIASPRAAIRVLEPLKGTSSAKLMKGEQGWEMDVGAFFNNRKGLLKLNESLQPKIDTVASQIERELGQKPIEVPALFVQTEKGGTAPWFPAFQNAQVINGTILAPDPMGPRGPGGDVLKAAFERTLPGWPIVYLDGCFLLHRRKGSVHCASNRLAKPSPKVEQWWLW